MPATDATSPPPQSGDCAWGPYIVFFGRGSVSLNARAREVLDYFVRVYASSCGIGPAMVMGHADRSGAAGFNRALSERRALVVARYLAAHGIPRRAIRQQAFGSSRPLENGQSRPPAWENRRAEVIIGPDLDH